MTADFGTPRVAASISISRSRSSGILSDMVIMGFSILSAATDGNASFVSRRHADAAGQQVEFQESGLEPFGGFNRNV